MLSLTRWHPFSEMTDFHHDVDRAFGRILGEWPATPVRSWLPATEATSGSDGLTLRMALPGVDPKDVHVELSGKVLTVSGERTVKDEQTDRHLSEIGYGRFERRFTLPDDVETDDVTATFEHGMLELTLPTAEATKPRRIEIAGTKVKESKASKEAA